MHILGCGERGSVQIGRVSGLACGNRDKVEPCRTALGYFDCHFVLGSKLLNVGKKVGPVALVVFARNRNIYLA